MVGTSAPRSAAIDGSAMLTMLTLTTESIIPLATTTSAIQRYRGWARSAARAVRTRAEAIIRRSLPRLFSLANLRGHDTLFVRPAPRPVRDVSEPDQTTTVAAALARLLPQLWAACFTPLPPGAVLDLPVGQARTLGHLSVVGRRRMGELAEDLGVKLPTATRIVDRLVERELVERSPCDRDRRVVWVEATAEGQALADAARRFRRGVILSRLERLDGRQRAALVQALELLEDVVSEPVPVAG